MITRIASQASPMRKQPRQARSRATIEAILQAGAHILAERGWSGLTTNGVAERAGASIGSLYQYFPNKLALIEGVRGCHFDDVLEILQAASDTGESRQGRIETLVDGMIAVHARRPAAHRVLLEDAPRGEAAKPMHEAFEMAYLGCYEALIASIEAGSRRGGIETAARVLSAALAGATHDAVRRGALEAPELRQALIDLVDGYLSMRERREGSRESDR